MALAPPKQRKRGLSQSSSSSESQQQDSKAKRFKGPFLGRKERSSRAAVVSSSSSSSPSSSSSNATIGEVDSLEESSSGGSSEIDEDESSESSDSQDSVKDQYNSMLATMSPGERSRYFEEQEEGEGTADGEDALDETSSSSSSSSSEDGRNGKAQGRGVARSSSPITSLPRPQKPPIGPYQTKETSNLLVRLSKLLPAMAEANKILEAERAAGRLDDRHIETVGDDEQYIEMNLGLGVLEHKSEDYDEARIANGESRDTLQKLLGKDEVKTSKPFIEEV